MPTQYIGRNLWKGLRNSMKKSSLQEATDRFFDSVLDSRTGSKTEQKNTFWARQPYVCLLKWPNSNFMFWGPGPKWKICISNAPKLSKMKLFKPDNLMFVCLNSLIATLRAGVQAPSALCCSPPPPLHTVKKTKLLSIPLRHDCSKQKKCLEHAWPGKNWRAFSLIERVKHQRQMAGGMAPKPLGELRSPRALCLE